MFQDTMRLLRDLHPHCRAAFQVLTEDLKRAYENHQTTTLFRPVEGCRAPVQQREALARGLDHVAEWHSAHQYGFAVRFQPYRTASGTTRMTEEKADWPLLITRADLCGLRVVHGATPGTVWHKSWPKLYEAITNALRCT